MSWQHLLGSKSIDVSHYMLTLLLVEDFVHRGLSPHSSVSRLYGEEDKHFAATAFDHWQVTLLTRITTPVMLYCSCCTGRVHLQ